MDSVTRSFEPDTQKPTPKPISFPNGTLKKHLPRPPALAPAPAPASVDDRHQYRECLRNHAASLGGHAVDGCCEFMPSPSADPAVPTSLTCAACGCHRNFHRRLPLDARLRHDDTDADDDEDESSEDDDGERRFRRRRRTSGSPPPYSSAPHMLLALSGAASGGPGSTHTMAAPITVSSGGFQGPPHAVVGAMPRKRFRTKFSSEQKERMQEMSERLGWRMQKKDEAVVEEFCRQIGVERGIFKVWMHNNKHTYHGSPSSKRNEYNGCTWKGGKLRLEKAKEHYFARLKREWAKDVNLATTVHLDMKKDAEHLKMSECLDQEKMQFRIFFPKLRKVCLMTDDTILDTVLGRQLGSGHSMRSKKSRSSSSGRSDDASVPEAVRTSMSMMQDQISYWMNHSQTLERIVAAVAERLGIDASELAPLQSHDAASAPPSRHVSGQGSTSGGGNEANESDHT